MKGVAERTLELLNEYQQSIPHKSHQTFQHFLVVKIDGLEDAVENITEQLHRVARERDDERERRLEKCPTS